VVIIHLNEAEVEADFRDHEDIERNEKEELNACHFLTDAHRPALEQTRLRNTCQGVQKESDQPRVCEPFLEFSQHKTRAGGDDLR
jgi:hypothetical protein